MTTNDLFNPGTATNVKPQSTELYKVSARQGKGGIYKAVIRFVPYYANPAKSIMEKSVCYVKNPNTGIAKYVDDPRSIGEFSPTTDLFFKFYNTEIPAYKEFAKQHLSSKQQYASLVQIISDENNPELSGQIKVFVYGKKIWDKLFAEEHPAVGAGVNPFHPIYGRFFSLNVTEQGGFNNYDQCYFFDSKAANGQTMPSGIQYINPATNQYEVVTEQTNQQAVADFLAQYSPDLSKYDYNPWTPEQTAFVEEVLAVCNQRLTNGNLDNNVQPLINGAQPNVGMSQMRVNAAPVFPGATPTPAAPTPNFNPAPTPTPSVTGVDVPTVTPAQAPAVAPGVGGLTSIDDVLANL